MPSRCTVRTIAREKKRVGSPLYVFAMSSKERYNTRLDISKGKISLTRIVLDSLKTCSN